MKLVKTTVILNLLAATAVLAAPPSTAPNPAALQAFRVECAARAAAAEKADTITVPGKDGWLFFGPELRHVSAGQFWGPGAAAVSRASSPLYADPLPAILDFKQQLDKAGIELLIVPVPPKVIVYPDKFSAKVAAGVNGPPRFDAQHQQFYDLLRKAGVNVVDLTNDLIVHRQDAQGPTYCKTDTHWSGRACVLAAQRLAGLIRTRPWFKAGPLKLSQQWKNVEIEGDLWQALGAATSLPKETLPLRFIGTGGGSDLQPVEPDPNSPVVLLGDSHNLVFHSGDDMHARGAGLADQLALELGYPVDLVAVKGSGATPARINLLRHARANPAYLGKKKVIIWCFTAREFTESMGWQKVPLVKM